MKPYQTAFVSAACLSFGAFSAIVTLGLAGVPMHIAGNLLGMGYVEVTINPADRQTL
jgi:hypothetical protein